ncbi:MAG: histidine phosphatase family protein [Kamptonema sp. SIO4C4]|nr:histidine phosphatase family protein [Kamptonema sp. SIO4C4]
MGFILLSGLGGLVACSPSPPDSPTPTASAELETVQETPQPPSEAELWSRLQNAEQEDVTYVVLLRHAIAPGTGDPDNFQLGDCTTQRNLSQAGRQQARDIGEAFRSRNIPVKQVFSSQWCRCLDTAELLNLGTVEPLPSLNSFFENRSQATEQTQQTQDFLLEKEHPSGVLIFVSHQVNIQALSGVSPRSGEAVVLDVNGELEVLGRIL